MGRRGDHHLGVASDSNERSPAAVRSGERGTATAPSLAHAQYVARSSSPLPRTVATWSPRATPLSRKRVGPAIHVSVELAPVEPDLPLAGDDHRACGAGGISRGEEPAAEAQTVARKRRVHR